MYRYIDIIQKARKYSEENDRTVICVGLHETLDPGRDQGKNSDENKKKKNGRRISSWSCFLAVLVVVVVVFAPTSAAADLTTKQLFFLRSTVKRSYKCLQRLDRKEKGKESAAFLPDHEKRKRKRSLCVYLNF